jgi:hypothetical protein
MSVPACRGRFDLVPVFGQACDIVGAGLDDLTPFQLR